MCINNNHKATLFSLYYSITKQCHLGTNISSHFLCSSKYSVYILCSNIFTLYLVFEIQEFYIMVSNKKIWGKIAPFK